MERQGETVEETPHLYFTHYNSYVSATLIPKEEIIIHANRSTTGPLNPILGSQKMYEKIHWNVFPSPGPT